MPPPVMIEPPVPGDDEPPLPKPWAPPLLDVNAPPVPCDDEPPLPKPWAPPLLTVVPPVPTLLPPVPLLVLGVSALAQDSTDAARKGIMIETKRLRDGLGDNFSIGVLLSLKTGGGSRPDQRCAAMVLTRPLRDVGSANAPPFFDRLGPRTPASSGT